MNAEAIQEVLRRQPFEPFEVRMSNGDAHPVRHPEFAMLLPSRLVVGDPVSDRLSILSLMHVAGLRMLEPSAH